MSTFKRDSVLPHKTVSDMAIVQLVFHLGAFVLVFFTISYIVKETEGLHDDTTSEDDDDDPPPPRDPPPPPPKGAKPTGQNPDRLSFLKII